MAAGGPHPTAGCGAGPGPAGRPAAAAAARPARCSGRPPRRAGRSRPGSGRSPAALSVAGLAACAETGVTAAAAQHTSDYPLRSASSTNMSHFLCKCAGNCQQGLTFTFAFCKALCCWRLAPCFNYEGCDPRRSQRCIKQPDCTWPPQAAQACEASHRASPARRGAAGVAGCWWEGAQRASGSTPAVGKASGCRRRVHSTGGPHVARAVACHARP